jgi:hypothetical protein
MFVFDAHEGQEVSDAELAARSKEKANERSSRHPRNGVNKPSNAWRGGSVYSFRVSTYANDLSVPNFGNPDGDAAIVTSLGYSMSTGTAFDTGQFPLRTEKASTESTKYPPASTGLSGNEWDTPTGHSPHPGTGS